MTVERCMNESGHTVALERRGAPHGRGRGPSHGRSVSQSLARPSGHTWLLPALAQDASQERSARPESSEDSGEARGAAAASPVMTPAPPARVDVPWLNPRARTTW